MLLFFDSTFLVLYIYRLPFLPYRIAFGKTFSSKTGVAKVYNISQNDVIDTVLLGETCSGVRDMAWLPSQVR